MTRAIQDLPALACRDHLLETGKARLGWLEPVPDSERHNRDALWARLEREGYLYLRQAIPAAAALEFRRYYFAALQNSGLLETDSEPVVGVASRLEFDRAMVRHILFDQIVPSTTYADFCFLIPPKMRN